MANNSCTVQTTANDVSAGGGSKITVHLKHPKGVKDIHLVIRKVKGSHDVSLGAGSGDNATKNYSNTETPSGSGWQSGYSTVTEGDTTTTYFSWAQPASDPKVLDSTKEYDFSITFVGHPWWDEAHPIKPSSIVLTKNGCVRGKGDVFVFGFDPKKDVVPHEDAH
jgi:hypothetical protein